MPKQINYQLSEAEIKQIERAQRTSPDPRVRQRAAGLRLLHMGKKPQEVAALLNVSRATISNWHAAWRAAGLNGLSDKPRSGRPPVTTAVHRARVEELLATDPTLLGHGFTCWTVARLIAQLKKETGIRMSINTMRSILDKLDYVCRRPKHDLKPLQDVTARATAKALLDELKKQPVREKSNDSLWTKQP